jgi:hypothetical protein
MTALCSLVNYNSHNSCIFFLYKLCFSYPVLGRPSEMSGGNFCRSRSLVDIRSLRVSTDDAAEGGHVVSHSYYSEAEGLELLSQDSPGDPSMDINLSAIANVSGLLDYESDGPEPDPEAVTTKPPARESLSQAAMDIEHTSTTPVINVMDSVYYQCRSARTLCQKDTLVSVSVDESFGKRVIVQSPGIGSLEDHDGISKTFHGSRVTKGNNIVTNLLARPLTRPNLCVSVAPWSTQLSTNNRRFSCSRTKILFLPLLAKQ